MVNRYIRPIVCICLACLFLLGCGRHEYPRVLVQIDSLADVRPDSAEQVLGDIKHKVTSMADEDQWFYRFLVLKSKVKQDKFPKNDKEAKALIGHYEDFSDKYVQAQVYYYSGCVYQMLGDMPQSIDYLQNALNVFPKEYKNQNLRARCFYMLGEAYNYQRMDKEALSVQKQAYEIDKAEKNTKRMVSDLLKLSWSLDDLYDAKNAGKALAKAYSMSEKMKDTVLMAEVACQQARFAVDGGCPRKAKDKLAFALKYTDENNLSAVYFIASRYYYYLGMEDSVRAYCEKLLVVGNVYGKQGACLLLGKYYKDKNPALAMHYYECYGAYTDTVQATSATEYATQAHAKYNYRLREEQNIQLIKDKKQQQIWILCIAFLSVVIIILLAFAYFVSRQRRERLDKNMKYLQNILRQREKENIEKEEKNKRKMEETLFSLSKLEKEKELYKQELEKREQEAVEIFSNLEDSKLENQSGTNLVKESDIFKELQKSCEEEKIISSSQIIALENLLFKIYPQFQSSLYVFKTMTDTEHLACLLIKAEFSVDEISKLMSRSTNTVYSIGRRLYEKNLSGSPSYVKWSKVIQSI